MEEAWTGGTATGPMPSDLTYSQLGQQHVATMSELEDAWQKAVLS